MRIVKNIFLALTILTVSAFFAISCYTLLVYVDYNKDKQVIFETLNEFAKILGKETETSQSLESALKNEQIERLPSVVYDKDGRIITKYANEKYQLVSIEQMPFFLTRGFIYIEDRQFFKHFGVNLGRLAKALFANIKSFGRSGGGSTISQQLAKILFTNQERSIKRKVYELFCTFELERNFTKMEILRIYLNSNYMGHGIYGIANAAKFYFSKPATQLTIAESALLVGMNRSPERYSPLRNRSNAEYILKYIIGKFVEAGYITEDDAQGEITRFWQNFDKREVSGSSQSIWKTQINSSGYLTEYVRQILESEFGYDKVSGGGLIVETTFDLERQLLAERVVSTQLRSIRERVKEQSIKRKMEYSDELISKVEGSFSSIDYRTGCVYALVGGSGYHYSNQLNRATSAYRQVGSTIKPFVYAKALDVGSYDGIGIHPFTKFKDEVVTYKVGGKSYTPKNYYQNHKYGSMVTMYDALKRSLNTVAMRVMSMSDVDEVAKLVADSASITLPNKRVPPVLSLALGTAEMTSLELASAFSIFARDGVNVRPITILKISDTYGNVFFDANRKNNPYFSNLPTLQSLDEKAVIAPETAYEVLQMMAGVLEPGGTGNWAKRVSGLNKMAYGKSGTTQNYKDGWFAGITASEASACWIGIDSGESLLMSGEGTAAVTWAQYNAKVFSDITQDITIPKNMKLVPICRDTGLMATSECHNILDFYFNKDSAIPERCYVHQDGVMLIEDGGVR